MKKAIQIDEKDNVATVTDDVKAGEEVEVLSPQGEVILKTKLIDDVIFGHKMSLRKLKEGEEIIKYGEIIGVASKEIPVGEWLHTHNVNSARLHTPGEKVRGVT
ncbi:MAG: UxaA family hydrolase [Candidatus Bathyarchaeota archaeon]|nr:UxaA family hydrolase [Candidatus Bathyarchaeota archaeon]